MSIVERTMSSDMDIGFIYVKSSFDNLSTVFAVGVVLLSFFKYNACAIKAHVVLLCYIVML